MINTLFCVVECPMCTVYPWQLLKSSPENLIRSPFGKFCESNYRQQLDINAKLLVGGNKYLVISITKYWGNASPHLPRMYAHGWRPCNGNNLTMGAPLSGKFSFFLTAFMPRSSNTRAARGFRSNKHTISKNALVAS